MSLATGLADGEDPDYDWTDRSLRWVKVTIRWICHVATLLMLMRPTEAHI